MNTACPCPDQEPDGGWAGRSDQRPQAGAGGGLLAQQNIIQELEVLRSSTSDLDLEDLRPEGTAPEPEGGQKSHPGFQDIR